MMRNQRKIVEKMTEDLNYYVFRGPKWLGNWASEADIQHPSKSSLNWHVNQDWCETSGNVFLENDQMAGIFTYSTQCGPKIWLLMPIFSTPLKVLAMSMWSNTDVKPVKTFWESNQKEEFWLIWGPKNWAFEAHIVHITESSCNGHKNKTGVNSEETF